MNVSTDAVNFANSPPWLWLRASLYIRPYLTVSLLLVVGWLSYIVLGKIATSRSDKTTRLNGPANPSFLFGLYRQISEAEDPGVLFEYWALQYGPAFRIPGGFGSSRIVICDARANAHFYSKETFCYVQTKLSRVFIENLFGRGLLWAEGESHRRQRKALSPAFSNAAIRKLTPVFYDAAYKTKAAWDSNLDAGSGEAIIDVQVWMNRIALDAVGIAGFGHDFHALDGKENHVVDIFESFASGDTNLISRFVFLMGPVFPILQKLPTKENLIIKRLKATMKGIAKELLERNREGGVGREKGIGEEKSIIGLLIKAETSTSSLVMSPEEILAQMNVLLLAGYETTSISLTWALIELCRKPEKQQRLREELSHFVGTDPSFDQLSSGLPYLDSVTQEVLRLHPPVHETTRVATQDDIIPFTAPITTSSGEQTCNLVISKGTVVTSPIRYMNRAEVFWGANAKEFEPERWLEGGDYSKAKEIQGHRHTLTFSDGPRTCLGKSFALTEFKSVLSVLIRSYSFDLPDGPNTKIEKHPSILPRPKVSGEVGAKAPMKVRRLE